MIRSVSVTNYVGDTLKLDLFNPEKSGFIVSSISGINPSKANINITEIVTSDGGLFNNARLESRNIVFNLIFLDNPTIEDTRHLSYKYFPIKRPITMSFETDNRTAEIKGYVESNEIGIFSKQEGCQISVICPDPNFYSDIIEHSMFSGIEPGFYFPFANQGLNVDTIRFGEVHALTSDIITYDGDNDVGLYFEINVQGTATNIAVHKEGTLKTLSIDTTKLAAIVGSGLTDGDKIVICTIRGKKSVEFIRNGVSTNILNCLNRDAEWFQLVSGDNVFTFTASTGITNLKFSTRYQIVYEGV